MIFSDEYMLVIILSDVSNKNNNLIIKRYE